MTNIPEPWEEEFDRSFMLYNTIGGGVVRDIKPFIHKIEQVAEKRMLSSLRRSIANFHDQFDDNNAKAESWRGRELTDEDIQALSFGRIQMADYLLASLQHQPEEPNP
jgi:hypothetical protein